MMNQLDDNSFEPAATLHVDHITTLRVLSDPLRAQIVELLRPTPHTVKQLAAELHISPKKLYYHVNMLEQHGLIRVASTRLASGIVEKTYRATAYLFLFDHAVFASEQTNPTLDPRLAFLFQATQQQLEHSVQRGLVAQDQTAPAHQRLFTAWNLRRMTPAQAEAFYERLAALLDEFNAHDDTAQAYRVFVTLFPVDSNAKVPGAPPTKAEDDHA